ncbi:MAG: enoyl-CoA hydratase-related protein [Pseudomonadota bacterium]
MAKTASDVENGIALIRLMPPGESALTPHVRTDLLKALEQAAEDGGIDGVVLSGTGATFASGLDLREYDQRVAAPTVRDLTLAIENHPKPVVAALNGAALEAGFEIALAAHARVARSGIKVALPQVSLGMVPAGGATQRLPRLTGAKTALALLLSGRAASVDDARLADLFAQITPDLPLREAQKLARTMADKGTWTKSCDAMVGLADPALFEMAIRTAYQTHKRPDTVEADIIRAVEAALLLPFEQGLDLEETAAEARRTGQAARARRQLFAGDRLAAVDVARLEAKAKKIRIVAVRAGGANGVALAASSLDLSEEVILFADTLEAAERLAKGIDAVLSGLVKQGVLTEEARDAMIDRLSLSDDPEVLHEADLVFDSGPLWEGRIGAAPRAVWCVLEGTVSALEQARRTGAETLVIQPYRPAHPASLVELVPTEEATPQPLATVARFFARMGRTVILHSRHERSLGERVSAPLYMAAVVLARHGADPQALEDATRQMGFPRGALDMIDRDGARQVLSRLSRNFPDLEGTDWLAERVAFMERHWPGGGALCSAGPEGPTIDPDLSAWLAGWRQRTGVAADVPDVPVSKALHAAVVNHVAAMMRRRRIARPELVDLCLVRGFGMARDGGGLLFQSDRQGLLSLLRAMKVLAPLSDLWTPDPLIEDMIKNGSDFLGQAGTTER